MPKIMNSTTQEIIEVSQIPTLINGVWECGNQRFTDVLGTLYEAVPEVVQNNYPKLTPMQFKMCFKNTERIAIKALKATDPIIEDAFDLLDDPRLTEVNMGLKSNQDLIDYLVSLTILTTERAAQIKAGVQL